MEIVHLGSGSRGNATMVRTEETTILIDCGFSMKQIERRLAMVDAKPDDLDAILVSHHHGDHGKSARAAAKKWGVEIHANFETCARLSLDPVNQCRVFESLERRDLGPDLSMLPIPIPHDDAENVAFVLNGPEGRAGFVTDLGESTEELIKHMSGCKHISVEANYDVNRLFGNLKYPQTLKDRIHGRGGHLSNRQTAIMMDRLVHDNLDSIVLCHLSSENNAPHLAESEVLCQIDEDFKGEIRISKQEGPEFTHWLGQRAAEPLRWS
tara:strand:+ start:141 stop:941 length:801 start_codon:yes stop_codon:yes gene_type:complete